MNDYQEGFEAALGEAEGEIQKTIDANDDGMWSGREALDKLQSFINSLKKKQ